MDFSKIRELRKPSRYWGLVVEPAVKSKGRRHEWVTDALVMHAEVSALVYGDDALIRLEGTKIPAYHIMREVVLQRPSGPILTHAQLHVR